MRQARGIRPSATASRAASTVKASNLGRSLQHPADRTADRRGRFDQFAERASFLASSPLFFVVCAALVVAWAVGLAVGASDRFEAATAGGMSALTLILVAVLKNSELRTERALHTKLDAIASALLEERRGHQGDAEEQLERSIGVHDEI
ncbi:MAG TPA: low affinity iron permease family protein [Solirubrobacteraceae bacterium]|jgi:low affinity Fe/Cu permease|nr:low affinity iron permease family protein [Solirubrobacteraceae bacterium]